MPSEFARKKGKESIVLTLGSQVFSAYPDKYAVQREVIKEIKILQSSLTVLLQYRYNIKIYLCDKTLSKYFISKTLFY